MDAIQNRYDFVYYFDVKDGNPNGDPDADNMPRTDLQTGQGLVTDVCLKRKIRNYVEDVKGEENGYAIYVHENISLETQNSKACTKLGVEETTKGFNAAKKDDPEIARKLRDFMCENYYDIRSFGAVMTSFSKKLGIPTGYSHVRGPIQLGFARSIDPIILQVVTITRLTLSSDDSDAEGKKAKKGTTMFGHKHIVPYGLYRVEGHISACLAQKVTGLTEEDVSLFWNALANMFDHDQSAARANMAPRKLVIFKHESPLGNAASCKLFERVTESRKNPAAPPRSFSDYAISVNRENLPAGVSIIDDLI